MDKWKQKDRQEARQNRYTKCIKEGVLVGRDWNSFLNERNFWERKRLFVKKDVVQK